MDTLLSNADTNTLLLLIKSINQLILSLERDDRVPELVEGVKNRRPHVSWPELPLIALRERPLEEEELLRLAQPELSQSLLERLKREDLYDAR